jgi:hypothetical protein
MRDEDCDDEDSSAYASEDEDYEYVYDDSGSTLPTILSPSTANLKTTGLDIDCYTTISTSTATTTSPELGVGCICTRCRQERHVPVQDCSQVEGWIAKRRQQATVVPPHHVNACVKQVLRTTSEFFHVTLEVAGVASRQNNWDFTDIARSLGQEWQAERRAREEEKRGKAGKPPPSNQMPTINRPQAIRAPRFGWTTRNANRAPANEASTTGPQESTKAPSRKKAPTEWHLSHLF